MLEILFSRSPVELLIRGRGDDLSALVDLLRSAGGTLDAADSLDPWPYDGCLAAVTVTVTDMQPVTCVVDEPARSLRIQGETSKLSIFADNLDDIVQESAPGTHHHFEYFPGHFYLGTASTPVVIETKR